MLCIICLLLFYVFICNTNRLFAVNNKRVSNYKTSSFETHNSECYFGAVAKDSVFLLFLIYYLYLCNR